MAWTDPVTWNTQDLVDAADLNVVSANLTFLASTLNTATGKYASLSSSTLDSTDGSAVTGIADIAHNNTFTGVLSFTGTGRLYLPEGANLYAMST